MMMMVVVMKWWDGMNCYQKVTLDLIDSDWKCREVIHIIKVNARGKCDTYRRSFCLIFFAECLSAMRTESHTSGAMRGGSVKPMVTGAYPAVTSTQG
jgi:hypothetical protein